MMRRRRIDWIDLPRTGWRYCPHGLFGWAYSTHRHFRFCRCCKRIEQFIPRHAVGTPPPDSRT